MGSRTPVYLTGLLAWAFAASRGDAQHPAYLEPAGPRPAVAFIGGPSPYDLAGTGTGAFGAVRFDIPSGRLVVIEPGVGVFRYTSQADESITYILPELSVQVQLPAGPVRPYAGGGLGFTEFLSGRGQSDVTLHAVGGVRLAVGGGWGLRGEARLRAIDPFKGNNLELGVGFTRTLGR